MAITDLDVFAHLTDADIENLAVELDAIRQDVEDSRGERDARYIHRTIAAQRALEVAGRLLLAAGSRRWAWWTGTVTLGVAKIIENMEIGHNVMHGQWDWMNDDSVGPERKDQSIDRREMTTMALTDVDVFAHLTDADIESLGVELDAIRQDIEDSRGAKDARYIRRPIAAQRALEVTGRLLRAASSRRSAWWAGTVTLGVAKIVENMEIGHNVMHGQWDWMNDPEIHSSTWEWDIWWAGTVTLGVAKIVENMEIGHNVMHGQWDWMNDPEIHSSTWEWDMSGSSKHWRYTHNFVHHKYTNILGMDDDVGYGLLRVTRDQKWKRFNLLNLVYNTLLALLFEWGVGLQHVELGKIAKRRMDNDEARQRVDEFLAKAGRQVLKDYVAFPALTSVSPGATYMSTLKANALGRNVHVHVESQCACQRDSQRVGQRGDLLWPFPRRRREIHQDRHDRRDKGAVVPASDAGQRELRGRPGAALHERQPVSPDRTPPVPGPAEQPAA